MPCESIQHLDLSRHCMHLSSDPSCSPWVCACTVLSSSVAVQVSACYDLLSSILQ